MMDFYMLGTIIASFVLMKRFADWCGAQIKTDKE